MLEVPLLGVGTVVHPGRGACLIVKRLRLARNDYQSPTILVPFLLPD